MSFAITRPVVVLPEPGFADEPEDLAAPDRQVDPVDRPDDAAGTPPKAVAEPAADREVDLDALEVEEVGGLVRSVMRPDSCGRRDVRVDGRLGVGADHDLGPGCRPRRA